MATPPATDRTRPQPAVKGDPAGEKRLAEALRANLRRRKAAAAAPTGPKEGLR